MYVPVVGIERTRSLETTDCEAVLIHPQDTTTVLQLLKQHPVPNWIKRIKKMDNMNLVLVGKEWIPVPGTRMTVQIPKHEPQTLRQFKEWNAVWPMTSKNYKDDLLTEKEVEIAQKYSNETACLVDPDGKMICSAQEGAFVLDHPVMVLISEKSRLDREKRKRKPNDYLMTGLDVHLKTEPCLMCAMALVHSRAKRIFYQTPNQNGALGSRHALHLQPINHKYQVWKFNPS